MKAQNNRTFLAWILVTASMLGTSFLWHHFILNDFSSEFQSARFTPLFYMGMLGSAYAVVSFFMVTGLYTKMNTSRYDVPLISGPIVGMISGLMVFMVMILLGVFYHEGMGIKALVLGALWQVAEQTVGGFVWGLVASAEIENSHSLA